jgi:hypothetical protein
MAQGITSLNKEDFIEDFPLLVFDPYFDVISEGSERYNCCAWAYQAGCVWMWPRVKGERETVGVQRFWPTGFAHDRCVLNFIEVFQHAGYQLCDEWEHEAGFQKIALYTYLDTIDCSHVAKEITEVITENVDIIGHWSSKMGQWNLIQHGSPYALDYGVYGNVYCIMKQQITERLISQL